MIDPVSILSALVGGVTVVAIALSAIGVLAYRRERRVRFLLVAGAFGILAGRSIVLAAGLFLDVPWEWLFLASGGSDALLVTLLYVAAVR